MLPKKTPIVENPMPSVALSAHEILEYWTEERMAQAEPLSIPLVVPENDNGQEETRSEKELTPKANETGSSTESG